MCGCIHPGGFAVLNSTVKQHLGHWFEQHGAIHSSSRISRDESSLPRGSSLGGASNRLACLDFVYTLSGLVCACVHSSVCLSSILICCPGVALVHWIRVSKQEILMCCVRLHACVSLRTAMQTCFVCTASSPDRPDHTALTHLVSPSHVSGISETSRFSDLSKFSELSKISEFTHIDDLPGGYLKPPDAERGGGTARSVSSTSAGAAAGGGGDSTATRIVQSGAKDANKSPNRGKGKKSNTTPKHANAPAFHTYVAGDTVASTERVPSADNDEFGGGYLDVTEELPTAWMVPGARCTLPDRGPGTVRWVGMIGRAERVGVELDKPNGLNDGSTPHGRVLFRCKPKHGVFVKAESVRKEEEEDAEQFTGFGLQI